MRNDNGADFDRWYRRVDEACASISGVGIDDLGDADAYGAWDGGASPEEYARERLAEEGFPSEYHRPASPFTVVGAVVVDTVTDEIRPVTYGDGSPEAAIASEDVRRANYRPARQFRNGRYVDAPYVPTNAALDAALKIRKAGAPLPRLY